MIEPHPISPRAHWAALWDSVVACAGDDAVRTDMGHVRWFEALAIVSDDGERHAGLWRPDEIRLDYRFSGDDRVVSHEMLHEALRVGHCAAAFVRCDPLEVCR